MEKFCEDLKALVIEVINCEKKKEIIPLTHREQVYHEKQKYCHVCWKKFCDDGNDKKYKKYYKVKDHDYYTGMFIGTSHSICNPRYITTKETPAISHNGSNYDYHFKTF